MVIKLKKFLCFKKAKNSCKKAKINLKMATGKENIHFLNHQFSINFQLHSVLVYLFSIVNMFSI